MQKFAKLSSNEQRATSNEQRITITIENDSSHLVTPNIIYNRFDLWINCDPELFARKDTGYDSCLRDGKFETLHANCGDEDYYMQVLYCAETAKLGVWMSRIPRNVLIEVVNYVFRTHKEVNRIIYRYCLEPLGAHKKINHFRIVLPESHDALLTRMPKHERQNLNSRLRKLKQKGTVTYQEYRADWDNPNVLEAFDAYFRFKNITHDRDFGLTARQYIQTSQTSNIYVLRCDDEVVAVRLSCEQCPIACGENIAYNTEYVKFAPGIVLQNYVLSSLINKGKTELFLGGSNYPGQTCALPILIGNFSFKPPSSKHATS